jgi:ubiquinone biosynthesis monooxygenase Coq7
MWETERHHLRTMDSIQHQHRVRPTVLYPIWKGAAMGLGVVTALMGKKSLMACTEAVETVIGEHYDE